MEARKKPEKPLDPDEESWRLWEERFQALTELASEWYWEQDENCRFTLMTGSTLGHGGSIRRTSSARTAGIATRFPSAMAAAGTSTRPL